MVDFWDLSCPESPCVSQHYHSLKLLFHIRRVCAFLSTRWLCAAGFCKKSPDAGNGERVGRRECGRLTPAPYFTTFRFYHLREVATGQELKRQSLDTVAKTPDVYILYRDVLVFVCTHTSTPTHHKLNHKYFRSSFQLSSCLLAR